MKPAAKKAPAPESSSDDDDDDEPVRKAVGKRAPEADSSDVEEPGRKSLRVESTPAVGGPNGSGTKETRDGGKNNCKNNGTLKRFERIDPTKVFFHSEEVKDNRPGAEHMILRQNQEMMRVKGKNFNKLKQKNKAKFYAAGVDTSVRAFQFDESD
ncbi:hypothetical protein DQ04_01331090 [Trypanosoma grayi]|uniref:hypothetical protein n=1 Tax=Trypanosoma grayi TaxID=71804 RepID=UPI0004F3F7A7|nr:hypothetical protein DQ04_01331090 [Trypanosoma grayi]KEG12922.1 hypothetical protein DQ04_01331090 [Trypanosoma grayi]